MKRDKLKQLIRWKNSDSRKPLIIRGARQVGKTWLMKEFGKLNYEQVVYLNFEKTKRLKSIFTEDFDIQRMIIALQVESALTIQAENTLLIFDEIQAIPEALTTLKYFAEEAPQYHIIAAGSLLGVALHADISFPVGKVEYMDLYPMSFTEFLLAIGEKGLLNILDSGDWNLISSYAIKFIEKLRYYYFVGGMPEAILKFRENFNFEEVRKIQKDLLNAYDQDFSKHSPVELVPRLRMVWNSLPAQLAKENKKFIYGLLKNGARAKEFELAITWLADCGQVYKIHGISKPRMPLKAYEIQSTFKLFMVDIGLLGAMTDLDKKTILLGNKIFIEFKGAFTEQYVLQQLKTEEDLSIYYWSSDSSKAEIDFVIQHTGKVVPIEVKAEENLQAKSLKVYYEKFQPAVSLRASMSDFRKGEWLVNVPLYAISRIPGIIKLG
ncbi:MAG: ATP-binding protein [Bacteroidetes bacterium]|nr:ATP-binding protein [Bacteroidota bacterium]